MSEHNIVRAVVGIQPHPRNTIVADLHGAKLFKASLIVAHLNRFIIEPSVARSQREQKRELAARGAKLVMAFPTMN